MTDDQNLQSLFDAMNQISASAVTGDRPAAGSGGGSQSVEGNMDANALIGLNPYMGANVTSFNHGGDYNVTPFNQDHGNAGRPEGIKRESFGLGIGLHSSNLNPGGSSTASRKYNQGGQLSPSEMMKVQNLGRRGDSQLSHINPQEAAMLEAMGGSGTINPYTGLPEYHWKASASHMLKHAAGAAGDLTQTIGSGLTSGIDYLAGDALGAASDVVGSTGAAIGEGVGAVGDAAFGAADDVIQGTFQGVKAGMGTVGDITRAVGEPITTGLQYGIDALSNLFSGGDVELDFGQADQGNLKRDTTERDIKTGELSGLSQDKSGLSNVKDTKPDKSIDGNWVGDKENPYVTPNVDDELDYANQGMKMPNNQTMPVSVKDLGMMGGTINQVVAMGQLKKLIDNAEGSAIAESSMINQNNMMLAKGGKFKPHMMYSPKTGKSYMADKLQDHLDMKEKGYDHRERNPENYPKAAYGMKVDQYNHGGSIHSETGQKLYGSGYEFYGQSTPYNDLDPYDQRAYLAEGMDEYNAQTAAGIRGETIMSADGISGKRKKTYTQGGRF